MKALTLLKGAFCPPVTAWMSPRASTPGSGVLRATPPASGPSPEHKDTMKQSARARAWRTETAGAVVIFLAGSLLHFAYAWIGEWRADAWRPAAFFAAVNESTWEHLKIAFWPGLLWALARYWQTELSAGAYWSARGYGLLSVSMLITIVFYGYTALIGTNLLAMDIILFLLAIAAGQAVFLATAWRTSRSKHLRMIGLALVVMQVLAFSAFTYWPPHLRIFQDPRNGLYGLEAHIGESAHTGR